MIWKFIFPAPHPKYVHPPGTTFIFFHLRENCHFEQNFLNSPYVPDGSYTCLMGAYTCPILSEVKTRYLKCVLTRFWAKFFLKILQPNPKGNWPKSAFWDPFSWSHKICSRGAILKIRIF